MRFIFATTLILCLIQGISQKNIILNWGPYTEQPKTIPQLYPLGTDFANANHFLALNNEGTLTSFDKNGSKIKQEQIIKLQKNEVILSGFRIPSRAYIFTKNTKNEVIAYRINLNKYELKEPKLISLFNGGEIKHIISEDSSKIAFYNIPDNKERIMKIRVVDSLLKKINEIDISFSETPVSIQNALLSNTGTFSVPCIKADGYEILSVSPGNKTINKTEYKYENNKALTPVFAIKGNSTFATVCYNKSEYELNCQEKIIFIQYKQGKQVAKKEIILDKCIENQFPIRLIAKSTDEVVLVNELFLTKNNFSNNQVFYGSFALFNFSFSKGKVTWTTNIFKNHYYITQTTNVASPHSDDYKKFTGHTFFHTNGKFYFLYNDNCSNCMNNGKSPMSQSAFDKSCLNLVSVDTKTGEFNRHYYAGRLNEKYLTNLRNCVLVDEKFVIVEALTSRIRNGVLQLN